MQQQRATDTALMAAEGRVQLLVTLQVPQLECELARPGEGTAALVQQQRAGDRGLMAIESVQQFTALQVPQFECAVGCGGTALPAQRRTTHRFLLAGEAPAEGIEHL